MDYYVMLLRLCVSVSLIGRKRKSQKPSRDGSDLIVWVRRVDGKLKTFSKWRNPNGHYRLKDEDIDFNLDEYGMPHMEVFGAGKHIGMLFDRTKLSASFRHLAYLSRKELLDSLNRKPPSDRKKDK
jgi:hypothetical protein